MRYVLGLEQVDETQVGLVGGKGARLGELARTAGIDVPPGFCVTTAAFDRVIDGEPALGGLLDQLSQAGSENRRELAAAGAEMRRIIEAISIPDDVAATVTASLARLGGDGSYAVRSSATAEDLPASSFAGQHDTFLNVTSEASVLEHLVRCWASLFSDRAVTYRVRHGIDHRTVRMAVVVQRMVLPSASGVVFTAHPVTSNRKVASVEAVLGLGEALVSGAADADVYEVRDDRVVDRAIATKRLATMASPDGGTREVPVEPGRQGEAVLTDAEAVQLARLARRIEERFGSPQDIEWCRADGRFVVVQSRPITTLFPVPAVSDAEYHVYVSVGHQQMMTDAMKPLGISFWQLTAGRPMHEAGGRLFVDVTDALASPSARNGLFNLLGRSDPLIRDALQTLLDRGDFVATRPDDSPGPSLLGGAPPGAMEADAATVIDLMERTQASLAAVARTIRTTSGPALFDFVLADIAELKQLLFDPQSLQVIMAAIEATWWLDDHLDEWLGDKSAADVLIQSVPHNVTSEMGYALLDVADVIRPHDEVVAFLRRVDDDRFLDEMATLPGGPQARDAISRFLDRYGVRCIGEIDITRPRWSEHPAALVPVIVGNIDNFGPGAATLRFERGLHEAGARRAELLARLRELPGGEQKAAETERMIDRVRTFIGYREFPKYAMVSRYALYKQAVLREAERLVRAGVLRERDDSFYLSFQELHDLACTNQVDQELIDRRKAAFATIESLRPPRVLTSEGEALDGAYRRDDVPAGALVGLAVSAGTTEGRARVILDMADAGIEPGDVLVTAHTDPSWSPLFVSIAGLVTEVGGLMSHGAVITREYGLPAVVGVRDATRLIRDGQRIRVNATEGYVEVLATDDSAGAS
jgi:rifampicin phosphotransferase